MVEKQCAHPSCRCPAELGKEFCSLKSEMQEPATPVPVPIRGAEVSISRSSLQMSSQTMGEYVVVKT